MFSGIKYLSASDWLAIAGTVEKASFKIVSSKPSTSAVEILYKYEVKGKTYENDRIQFGINIASNNPIIDYREGSTITIFYNPNSPEDSVINKNSYQSIWFGTIVGLIFIGFSLIAARVSKNS